MNGGTRVPNIPLKCTFAIEILSLAALVLLTSAAIAETVKVHVVQRPLAAPLLSRRLDAYQALSDVFTRQDIS